MRLHSFDFIVPKKFFSLTRIPIWVCNSILNAENDTVFSIMPFRLVFVLLATRVARKAYLKDAILYS